MAEISLIPDFSSATGTNTVASYDGVKISVDSFWSTTYTVKDIADKSGGNTDSVWVSAGGTFNKTTGLGDQKVIVELDQIRLDKPITRYTIQARNNSASFGSPKKWTLRGYDNIDGVWVDIHTIENQTFVANEIKSYTIPESLSRNYQQYEFRFLENDKTTDYVAIAELDIFGDSSYGSLLGEIGLVPDMNLAGTTNPSTFSGVTISSSSYFMNMSWYAPKYAFDRINSGEQSWISDYGYSDDGSGNYVGNQWLEVDFGSNTTPVYAYTITSRNYNGEGISWSPKSWKLQGFDGMNWVDLDARNDVPVWSQNEKRKYTFTPTIAYNKYRMVFTKTQGYTFVAIGELQLIGTTATVTGSGAEPPTPIADVYLLDPSSDIFYVSRINSNRISGIIGTDIISGYVARTNSSKNISVYPISEYDSVISGVKYSAVAIREITAYEFQRSFYASVGDDVVSMVFDNSNTTYWYTPDTDNTNVSIVYDFQSPTDWSAYSLVGTSSIPQSHPKSWKIYSSNDELNWNLVDERTASDYGFTNSSQEMLFRLSTSVNSRYFKIEMSEPNNPLTNLALANLNIFNIPLTEKSLISLVNVISEPEYQGSSFKKLIDSCLYPLIRHQNHSTYVMKSGYVGGSSQDPFRFGESYKALNLGSNMYWLSYYDAEPGIFYQYIKPKKRLNKISFEIRTNVLDSVGVPRKLTIQASNRTSGWIDIETYENQTFNLNSVTEIERTPDQNEKYYLSWRLKFSDFDRTNEKFDVYDYLKPSPHSTTDITSSHFRLTPTDNLYDKTNSEFVVTKVQEVGPIYIPNKIPSNWMIRTISIQSAQPYESIRKFNITHNVTSKFSNDFSVYLVHSDGTETLYKNMTLSDMNKDFWVDDSVITPTLKFVDNTKPEYNNIYQIQLNSHSDFSTIANENKQKLRWVNPYKTDTNGDLIFDSNQEPIPRYEMYEVDSNGDYMLDINGDKIPRTVWPLYSMDDNGNVVLDSLGAPVPFLLPYQVWKTVYDPITNTTSYELDSSGNRIRLSVPNFPIVHQSGVVFKVPVTSGVDWDYNFYKAPENFTTVNGINLVQAGVVRFEPAIRLWKIDTRNVEVSIKTTFRDHRLPSRYLFSYSVKSAPNKPFPKSWKVYGVSGTTRTEIHSVFNETFLVSGEEKLFHVTDDDRSVLTHQNPVDHFDTYLFEILETSDAFERSFALEEIELHTYEPKAVTNSRICLSDISLWTLDKCEMFCNDEDVYVVRYPLDLHKDGSEIAYFKDSSGDEYPMGKVTSTTQSIVGYEPQKMFDPFVENEWRVNGKTAELIYEFYEYGFTDPSDQFVKIKAESVIHGIEIISAYGSGDSTQISPYAPKDFEVYSEKLDGSGWDLLFSTSLQDEMKLRNAESRQFWFKEIGKYGATKRVKFVVLNTNGQNLRLNSIKFFASFPCKYQPLDSDLPLNCDNYYATTVERISVISPKWECYEITGTSVNSHISGSLTTAKTSQLIFNPSTDNQYSAYRAIQTAPADISFRFKKSATNSSISNDIVFGIDIYGPKSKYSGTPFTNGTEQFVKFEHFSPKHVELYGRNDSSATWDLVQEFLDIPVVEAGEIHRLMEISPRETGIQFEEYRLDVKEFHGTTTYPFSGYYEDDFVDTSLIPNMTTAVLNSIGTTATLSGVVATASSVYNRDYSPRNAFNKTHSLYSWTSVNGSFVSGVGLETLTIDLGNSVAGKLASFYSIRPRGYIPEENPKSWKFYGWNATSNWVLLDERSNELFTGTTQRDFTIDVQNVEYSKFKLEVTENGGHSYLSIGELDITLRQLLPVLRRTWPIYEAKMSLVGIQPCPFDGSLIDAYISKPECRGSRSSSPSLRFVDNPLMVAREIFYTNLNSLYTDNMVYENNIITNVEPNTLSKDTYIVTSTVSIEVVKKILENVVMTKFGCEILDTLVNKIGLQVEFDVKLEQIEEVIKVVDYDFLWKKRNGLLPQPELVIIKPFEERIAWGVQST